MTFDSAIVVYASKYGSTAEYAMSIAQVLDARAMRADEVVEKDMENICLAVLGSPIYGHGVLPEMTRFLNGFRGFLEGRTLAAFVVCGDTLWNPRVGEGGEANLNKLTSLLPMTPVAGGVFGGRMRMAELDSQDRPRIEAFYKRLGRTAVGFDRMEIDSAKAWARHLGSELELFPKSNGRQP